VANCAPGTIEYNKTICSKSTATPACNKSQIANGWCWKCPLGTKVTLDKNGGVVCS
jgi:hypothetical protein